MDAATTVHGESEAALLARHEKLIRYMALPLVRHGALFEDLVQEGRIAFLNAVRTWRVDGGASLWTWARRHVLGAMFRFVTREMHAPSKPAGDDTDTLEGLEERRRTPEEEIDDVARRSAIADALLTLTPEEGRMVRRHFSGESLRDLETSFDLSHATMQRTFRRAIDKLRDHVGVEP